mgnify:CR=1 FL=1
MAKLVASKRLEKTDAMDEKIEELNGIKAFQKIINCAD